MLRSEKRITNLKMKCYEGTFLLPEFELGPALPILEGFSSIALKTDSKSFVFLLFPNLFTRSCFLPSVAFTPSVSLIF